MARLESMKGRGVLVTGASSGIGRIFALRAAREGARLALVARRAAMLEALADECRDAGGEAIVIPCDVADRAAAARAVTEAEERLSGVDVALINAGVGRHRTLVEHDLDDAERLIRTNLLGALYFAHPLARAMSARGRGHMIFLASIAGLVPVPGETVYSASKFGLVGLAEALSIELEPRGVHVLTVCPGAVRTGFVPDDELARMPDAAKKTMVEPEAVVEATMRALARGAHRIIVPKSLEVAVAMRGLAPGIVRRGTARATRSVFGGSDEG